MRKNFGQSGQVVVEYVLLLAVGVGLAALLVSQLVKRDSNDPENSGALIRKWVQMQKAIGDDLPNK